MSTIEIVGPIVEANAESNLESCNMHKMDSSQSLPQEARSDAWWINFERARDNPSLSHVSSSTGSSGECCETSFPLPSKRPCNPQGYAGFLQECIEGRSHTPAKKNSPRFVSLHDDQEIDAEKCSDMLRIFVPSARRSFSSLSEAVSKASKGDVIVLKAGSYHEENQILLEKDDVTLQVEQGSKATVLFAPMKKAAIVCKAQGIKLAGLTLQRTGILEKVQDGHNAAIHSTGGACVRVDSGNVRFERCTIKCQTGPAIMVQGDSRPTVLSCILTENHTAGILCGGHSYTTVSDTCIKRNTGFGLWLLESADGMFRTSKIGRNSKCGILVCGQAKGTFDQNKVSNGGQGGFWMQGESESVVTNNIITRNHRAAMQVGDSADPIVANNTILEGEGGGIVVHDKARGLFFRNNLTGSCRAGAGVMDSASPLFLGNVMRKNNGGGAVVAGDSTPSFIGNEFISNGFVGVGMKENSKVLMQGNIVTGTEGYGVLMQGHSNLHLQDTRLEKNQQSGLCACDSTTLKIYGCQVMAGDDKAVQQCGITMHGSAQVYMEHVTVTGHTAGNVLLNDESSGCIMNCQISGSRSSGVTLQGKSSARIFRSVITGNRVSNVLALDQSKLVAEWNSIMEAAGCGIRTMGTAQIIARHNTIMGNAETGVASSGCAKIFMSLNRVSQNGKDGVCLDNAEEVSITDNAIFENGACGLRLKNTINCKVTGNLLLASTHKRSTSSAALVLRGAVGGHLANNVLYSKPGAIIAGDAIQPLLAANCPCSSQEEIREATELALATLHSLEQQRDGIILVKMPDGSTCVAQNSAMKVSKMIEAQHPRATPPHQVAEPASVETHESGSPESHAHLASSLDTTKQPPIPAADTRVHSSPSAPFAGAAYPLMGSPISSLAPSRPSTSATRSASPIPTAPSNPTLLAQSPSSGQRSSSPWSYSPKNMIESAMRRRAGASMHL